MSAGATVVEADLTVCEGQLETVIIRGNDSQDTGIQGDLSGSICE